MRFHVTLNRDEDEVWVAECPSIPGCVSQGTTREEALKNLREAIVLCFEVRSEHGLPLPAGPYPVLQILRSLPPDPTFFDDLGEVGGVLEDFEDPWKS